MAYPLGTDIDTSLEGKVEILKVGTLQYDFLDPSPTGTTKWNNDPTNPANIYNIGGGSVGIGVVSPTTKLDVSGGIKGTSLNVGSGSVTCGTLNYTSLNPPLPPSTGNWTPDGSGGIYRDSKVAIGSGGVVQSENFYVNGNAKFNAVNSPVITGLNNLNGTEYDYVKKVYNCSWAYFNGGSPPVRPAYLTRNGDSYRLTTTGLVQRFSVSPAPNSKIVSSYFIPVSDVINGKPSMIWNLSIANGAQGVNPFYTAFGTLALTESAGFYRIEISKDVQGNPFDSFSIAAQAWTGFQRIDISWSIYDGSAVANGETMFQPELKY